MDIFKNVQNRFLKKTFGKNMLLKTLPENYNYFVIIFRNKYNNTSIKHFIQCRL